MKPVLHVFPDTNIFLHYPPLSNIDWQEICDADEVHVVLCLEVVKELDDKKGDSRLGDRAKRAIKEIRQAHNADGMGYLTLTKNKLPRRRSRFYVRLAPTTLNRVKKTPRKWNGPRSAWRSKRGAKRCFRVRNRAMAITPRPPKATQPTSRKWSRQAMLCDAWRQKTKRGAGGSRTHGGGFAIYRKHAKEPKKLPLSKPVDTEFDTDLVAIIRAWPNLTEIIREAIRALIAASDAFKTFGDG